MSYRRFLFVVGLALALFGFVAANPRQEGTPPWAGRGGTGAQASKTRQSRSVTGRAMTATDIQKIFPYLSGGAQQVLSSKLGVQSLMGKKLDVNRQLGLDNVVNTDDATMENEPSIAVNPVNDAIVVAFHHNYPATDQCLAMVSFDGGDTFNYNNAVLLPLQAVGNSCSDPIVRFSPDGRYAYFVYMDVDVSGSISDIVLVQADGYNPLVLLSGPIVVINDYGDLLDKPWVDVAYYDGSGASDPVVYVTTTAFASGGDCGILFNASGDYGTTWDYGDMGFFLDVSSGCNPVLQGSRPIGNPYSGWVSVCWYDSGFDGWLSGGFFINCWSNDAWGRVTGTDYYFTPVFQKFEPSHWLSPNGMYHRWWNVTFPALAVDDTGLLYIGFAADPTKNPNDAEAGDVYLARGWPDGSFWKTMVVADGGPARKAQGHATVTARCDEKTNKCYAYVGFEDYRKKNEQYRVVYRKFTRPYKWFGNPGRMRKGRIVQISDNWSFSDFEFIGDYIDSFLTDRRYGVIWTDRADATGIYDLDDDVLMDVMVP